MSKHYELVIFTASLSKYAEPLMLQLDPQNLCGEKLFREHCTFYNKNGANASIYLSLKHKRDKSHNVTGARN